MKDQLDIRDMYRTLHPKTAEYTFSRSAHGTFSRIESILSHITNFNRLKIEIIPSIFSDNNVMKSEINYRKKKRENNSFKLNNILLKKNKNNGSTIKSRKKSENTSRQTIMKI